MNGTRVRASTLAILTGYTIVLRLLPYWLHGAGIDWQSNLISYAWNFSPVFALSLFGGARFRSPRIALLLPLAIMLASDIGIWLVTGRSDWAFYPSQFFVYASLMLCAAIGLTLRERRGIGRTVGAAWLGCTAFFLITNFAHWALQNTYPKTSEGLLACYLMGLVTYRNSLLATALFGSVLCSPLGVYATAPPSAAYARAKVEA